MGGNFMEEETTGLRTEGEEEIKSLQEALASVDQLVEHPPLHGKVACSNLDLSSGWTPGRGCAGGQPFNVWRSHRCFTLLPLSYLYESIF